MSKDITVVLDRRTNLCNNGDFVTCCNCGRTMLVDIGTDRCPECDEETLMWADDNNQEVDENFIDNNDNYILVDAE